MTEIKYKSEVVGNGGISARIVAHSKSAYSDTEVVTWEYEAPKCILAELNTHRMFSRNAQSSRAVPVKKVIEQIRNNPVTPIHWGSNQAGMVAGEEIEERVEMWEGRDACSYTLNREDAWYHTACLSADAMEAFDKAGYHKQIVNRIGEAFTFVRGVITATEFDNFFHLRIHPAADPFIQELARCMWEAYQQSEPTILYEGEWHLPYVDISIPWEEMGKIEAAIREHLSGRYGKRLVRQELMLKAKGLTIERAKQISAAACAQVSFRKLDLSDETVDRVYSRLVDDETPHASCVEHQATPIWGCTHVDERRCWEDGVTHLDKDGNLWSGNFKHWIQNRKLIPNEVCLKYVEKNK